MNILKKIDTHFEEAICITLLAAMTMLICTQVVCRFFSIQLATTEELGRYCFVWLIYMGCAAGIKHRRHLKIDAVKLLFKEKGNFILDIISNALFVVFCLFLIYYGGQVLYKIVFIQQQTSPTAQISMGIPYSSFWIGSFIMIFRLIQDTIRLVKDRKIQVSEKAGVSK